MPASDRSARPLVVAVLGPTASGKTAAAIAAASRFGAEIVSADSRQFYQHMPIGTAQPTAEERAAAPHHFVDFLSVDEYFSAGRFAELALERIAQLHRKTPVAIVAGGSGLYVKALLEGFDDLPPVSAKWRDHYNRLWQTEGLIALQRELLDRDPALFAVVDQKNPVRLIRGLEVLAATGRSLTSFRQNKPEPRPFDVFRLAIDWPRAELYERINRRVDRMMAAGLETEVRALYPFRNLNALQTVGYTELFAYFDGEISRDRAVELIKRNSRRYAKRQLTWLRRTPDLRWFAPGDQAGMMAAIENRLAARPTTFDNHQTVGLTEPS